MFASTGGAIYGEQDYFPADEKHPTEPKSPYGIAKLAVEKYLQFYLKTYGLSFVILRYANVYGPRQNARGEAGVVAIFTEKLLKGEIPIINGDGKQTRDYVFVEDVVACNVEALKPTHQGIVNVGTGIETDVNTIANELVRLTDQRIEVKREPAQPGEQLRSCLKPGALQKSLPIPLSEGLRKTVNFFRNK
jgi:UDP-glucose 4-epimerase